MKLVASSKLIDTQLKLMIKLIKATYIILFLFIFKNKY